MKLSRVRPFLLLLVLLAPAAQAAEVAFGPSARPQSYSISLRGSAAIAPEIEYVSEGRQPYGIPNINRVAMLNLVAAADLTPTLQAFVKCGLASSRWSTNGSGNGYSNPGRFGYDLGAGLTWWIVPRRWGLRLETLHMRHQQSDEPKFETLTMTSLQIVRQF